MPPNAHPSPPPSLRRSREQTKVSYKQLGDSGLRISVPILGTMAFGIKTSGQPWLLSDEQSILELLKGAYERGLNTWDTANIIGRAIQDLQIPRRKLILMTKIGMYVPDDPNANAHMYPWMGETIDYVNQGGLSRTAIFNAVDGCLARLQTNYIDLLQVHRYDPSVKPEETMKALHDLVQAGKVRYIGACSMWTYQFQRMQDIAERNGWTKFVSMQNQYSLCYREEEREMIKYCKETGIGIIPWSPLYRGLLARPLNAAPTVRSEVLNSHPVFKYMVGADEAIVKRVEEVATQRGWKMSQVALVWLLQKGAIPIVGMSCLERVDEAIAIREMKLTEVEMMFLEELYLVKEISGHY